MKSFFSRLLIFLSVIAGPGAAGEEAENRVVALTDLAKPGQVLSLGIEEPLALYDTRAARRVLVTLPAGQTLTVLAMDRYGLEVRGKGKNGPIGGWISQKAAFHNTPAALSTLAQVYQRQQKVEALVAEKQVAIGMTLQELTRILGAPTKHHIVAESGKSEETATWTTSDTVDLGSAFRESFEDVGVTAPVWEMTVETGRLTATLVGGVAQSIDANFGGPGKLIPEITPPIKHPFLVITPAKP